MPCVSARVTTPVLLITVALLPAHLLIQGLSLLLNPEPEVEVEEKVDEMLNT
jgi:hypothetical protein